MDENGWKLVTHISRIAGWMLQATAVYLLWGWFLVPLGLPAITFLATFGITLLVGVLRTNILTTADFIKSEEVIKNPEFYKKSSMARFLYLGLMLFAIIAGFIISLLL